MKNKIISTLVCLGFSVALFFSATAEARGHSNVGLTINLNTPRDTPRVVAAPQVVETTYVTVPAYPVYVQPRPIYVQQAYPIHAVQVVPVYAAPQRTVVREVYSPAPQSRYNFWFSLFFG